MTTKCCGRFMHYNNLSALPQILLATVICGASITALAYGAPETTEETDPKKRRPNVILIMSDDQGWGDFSLHGNELIDTPVSDRLAMSGARFARFYVSPVCAPTRASILTGRYHPRTGMIGIRPGLDTIRSEEVTIAEMLTPAGYVSGCFGKWHNGTHYPCTPRGQGFEEFLGFCAGHWSNYFDAVLQHNGHQVTTRGYLTDVLTDAALAFIERNRTRPFFCYVPYNAPHVPNQVPDRYFDKYKRRGLDDPTACTYGMCENIDDNVGRILAALDRLQLAERTVVIFLTDNGPHSSRFNAGLRGRKKSMDEGGVRVPLMIRWPGRIAPGTRIRELAADIDLLPTIAQLCGVTRPETRPLDGLSLVPLILGRAESWPDRRIFSYTSRRGIEKSTPCAVRTDRYRLVNQGDGYRLYDMIADPGQETDIASTNRKKTAELVSAYESWFQEVTANAGQRVPIPIGYVEAPEVDLPVTQGERSSGLNFSARSPGWNHDWIAEWANSDESIAWQIDVVRQGVFDVELLYACPPADVGSTVDVRIGEQRLSAVIRKAHDPPVRLGPDRGGRHVAYEKEWATLSMGRVRLGGGKARVTLKAVDIPGLRAMQVKSVRMRREMGQ